MRTLILIAVVVAMLGTGCSRKEQKPAPEPQPPPPAHTSAPAATVSAPVARATAARPAPVAVAPTNERPPIVSCNGRFTNLVYLSGDLEKTFMALYDDENAVTLEDIERECAIATNNADLWMLRAMMARGTTSNQITYTRTAARLAPDAILPQVMLASTLAGENQKAEAKQIITSVFDRVSSPDQVKIWASTAAMMTMDRGYRRGLPGRPEGPWLDEFFAARSNSVQARYAGMMLALYKPDSGQDKSVDAARAVFAASNEQFRAAAVELLFAMKMRNKYGHGEDEDEDVKPMAGIDELLETHATPYEKAMVKMTSMSRGERRSKGVAASRDAIKLATNAEMRIAAVFPLLEDTDLLKKDTTNMEALIVEAFGEDGWNSRHASAIISFVCENGTTATVLRLLAAAERHETNDASFALGVIRGCTKYDERIGAFELGLAERVRARFPTNESVLRALANLYEQGNLLDDAIACRTTLIAQISSPSRKAGELAELIGNMVKNKDLDAVQPLVDQHRGLTASNSSLAVAVSQFMLASGRTNDAGTFLLSCYAAMPEGRDRSSLLYQLLERKRFDTATVKDAVGKVRDLMRTDEDSARWLGDQAVSALIGQKSYDEAFVMAGDLMRKGEYMSSLYQLRDVPGGRERLGAMVQKWMQEGGSTQEHVNAAVAQMCEQCGLGRQAMELQLRDLASCTSAHEVVMAASDLLDTATSLGDKKQVNELLGMLDKAMTDPEANFRWLEMLRWRLKRSGCEDKLDAWFDQIWQKATNKPALALDAASFCMERDRTGMVKELVALLAGDGSLSLNKQWELRRLYAFTGDKAAAAQLRTSLKAALTNEQMILRYGSRYLSLLDDERDKGDEQAEHEIRALVLEWIKNEDITLYQRLEFCEELKEKKDAPLRIELLEQLRTDADDDDDRERIESELVNEYLERYDTGGFFRIAEALRTRPDTDSSTIEELAEKYEELGMYAEAVVLIEQLMEDDEDPDTDRLRKKAELYLKLGDKDQAMACIDEAASQAENDYSGPYMLEELAELCQKAGKPDKGLALVKKAFEDCTEISEACDMAENLIRYAADAEIELDAMAISARLLALERSSRTLAAAAKIACDAGNMKMAKDLVAEAMAMASSKEQKMELSSVALDVARDSGDAAAKVKAIEMSMECFDRRGMGSLQAQLVEALTEAGECGRAIQKANEFMAAADKDKLSASDRDKIREELVVALQKSGDKDGAWQAAQQLDNVNRFLAAAKLLGTEDKAVEKLESEFDTGDASKKTAALTALVDLYERSSNSTALAKLMDRAAMGTDGLDANLAQWYARALHKSGKRVEAVNVLKKAYDQGNRMQKEQMAGNIPMILAEAGEFKESLAWLEGRPQNADTMVLKSRVLALQGNTADAVRACCDALDAIPAGDDRSVNGCFTTLKTIMGTTQDKDMVDSAIARIKRSGNMHDASLHANIGELYNHAKRYEESVREYEKAAALATDEDDKMNYLKRSAHGYALVGDNDKAVAAYRRILDDKTLGWDERDDLRVEIAGVYEKASKPKDASDVYRENIRDCESHIRIVSKAKDTVQEQFRLAELYTKVGDTGESTRLLKKIADDRPGSPHATRASEQLKKMGTATTSAGAGK